MNWVKVEDKLPDDHIAVLIWHEKYSFQFAWYYPKEEAWYLRNGEAVPILPPQCWCELELPPLKI